MSCAICETRKEKRFCPAAHARICPQCCGEQREVTLDCPSDCPYLQQARQNERPREGAQLPLAELLPEVEIPDRFVYEREPLLVGLTFTVSKRARLDRSVNDRDAIAALKTLAKSYQTLVGSGLVYEERTASVPQQALVEDMQKMIAEYRAMEEKHLGSFTLRDSDALRGIVFVLRLAEARTSGRPKSRAFLDFLFAQFPEKGSGIVDPSQDTSHRIVVP